ncbi:1-phosphofructokinase [Radiobacillus sp. PE A8.2]|uniref:1-phosphofructokinase n=1 Tax=Radiobacillus sp. PE A8.2 TaxID=3380349 RepID=UPI0038903C21
MIYTMTLNPSIDYIVQVEQLHLGELNKIDADAKYPGGKGINVSRILERLGTDSTALGLLGGFTGDFIEDWLQKDNIKTDFIRVQDDTRINIKLKSDTETEINGRGPHISTEEANLLLEQLKNVTDQDVVILSGSKPPSLPENFYETIAAMVIQSKAEFVIDTASKELQSILPLQPLLVKPNKEELAQIFDTTIEDTDDIILYGKKLLQLGAKNAIVSMAGEGAMLFTQTGVFKGISPKGKVVNSVGAGDSMIAGFIANYLNTKDTVEAFKQGMASGSATAFTNDLATKAQIDTLLDQMEVQVLS